MMDNDNTNNTDYNLKIDQDINMTYSSDHSNANDAKILSPQDHARAYCNQCQVIHDWSTYDALNNLECVPPVHILQFGSYLISNTYRLALYHQNRGSEYTAWEIVKSSLGKNPNFPSEQEWERELRKSNHTIYSTSAPRQYSPRPAPFYEDVPSIVSDDEDLNPDCLYDDDHCGDCGDDDVYWHSAESSFDEYSEESSFSSLKENQGNQHHHQHHHHHHQHHHQHHQHQHQHQHQNHHHHFSPDKKRKAGRRGGGDVVWRCAVEKAGKTQKTAQSNKEGHYSTTTPAPPTFDDARVWMHADKEKERRRVERTFNFILERTMEKQMLEQGMRAFTKDLRKQERRLEEMAPAYRHMAQEIKVRQEATNILMNISKTLDHEKYDSFIGDAAHIFAEFYETPLFERWLRSDPDHINVVDPEYKFEICERALIHNLYYIVEDDLSDKFFKRVDADKTTLGSLREDVEKCIHDPRCYKVQDFNPLHLGDEDEVRIVSVRWVL